jgi:hypothetical protein
MAADEARGTRHYHAPRLRHRRISG